MNRRRIGVLGAATIGLLALAACAGRDGGTLELGGTADPGEESRPPVEARASVDRAVATTGDLLEFRLTVEHDPGYEVEIPEVGAAIEGFRIVDSFAEEPVERRGRRVESRVYALRADLVGSYILPAATVLYRPRPSSGDESSDEEVSPDGWTGEVSTSEIFVEVESVLPADGSAEDIRGLKPLRRFDRGGRWRIAVLVAAAVALAAGLALLWLRRRRAAPPAPREPADVVAFRALDALREAELGDPRAVRRFYFAISEVLRAYVEGRFGLNATDLTSDEILAELPRLGDLAEVERERLRGFLVHTDRVKFAEHRPTAEEIESTWEAALGFVEATRAPRQEELAA